MDVTVFDPEFLRLALVVVKEVDGEGAPFGGAGLEIVVGDVEVASADGL